MSFHTLLHHSLFWHLFRVIEGPSWPWGTQSPHHYKQSHTSTMPAPHNMDKSLDFQKLSSTECHRRHRDMSNHKKSMRHFAVSLCPQVALISNRYFFISFTNEYNRQIYISKIIHITFTYKLHQRQWKFMNICILQFERIKCNFILQVSEHIHTSHNTVRCKYMCHAVCRESSYYS